MSLDAMKQALESICSARLCEVNSMSSREEMLRLMSKAADTLRAAIEQAKPWVKTYAGGEPQYTTPEEQPEQEPVAWILEWIEDGEVYASKLYESERRCRYDAKKDTNAVCRPLVYGDKLKEKNNG